MVRRQTAVWLCIVLYVLGNPAYAAGTIYGKWIATESSQGGLRSALTITTKGQLISTVLVMLDLTYSVDKDKIIFGMDGEKIEYLISRDKETMEWSIPGTDEKLSLTRTYKEIDAKENSILGHWFFIHDSGGEAYYVFQDEGRGNLIVLMPGETISRIKVVGNSMSVKNPSRDAESVMTWEIIEGQLSLTSSEAKSWRYKPVEENMPIRPNKLIEVTPKSGAPH